MTLPRIPESPSWPRAMLTAIVLGMSWTWCIGMFLPVLLVRDLGIAAFYVFAIPNIVGAAAMGWVLRSAAQSRRMVHRHAVACIWFSLVTIVFHAFFAAWIIARFIGWTAGYCLGGGFLLMLLLVLLPQYGPELGAVLALLISLSLAAWGIAGGDLPHIAHQTSALPTADVYWLAPVCLLGFLLCPYLDLTFHAARQSADAPRAKAAFTLGFGGFFALMIAFTLLYSGWFTDGLPFAAGDRQLHWRIWLILPIHLAVQSCYTVALHVRQLIPQAQRITPRRFAVFCGLFLLAITLGNISTAAPRHANLSLGEITYRGFMSFYGLVFPAYVLLKITPSRQVATTWVWAAILLAAPFYEVGFIERQTIWLLPGVGIVLLFWVYRLFASFAPSR